ncbi:hypothetical protein Tco_1458496 [Tanacetum coccineum]
MPVVFEISFNGGDEILFRTYDSNSPKIAFSDADHAGCLDNTEKQLLRDTVLGDKTCKLDVKETKLTTMVFREVEYVAFTASCAISDNNVLNVEKLKLDHIQTFNTPYGIERIRRIDV